MTSNHCLDHANDVTVVAQVRTDSTSRNRLAGLHLGYQIADRYVDPDSIKSLPLFHGLTPSEIRLVAKRFERVTFSANHVVFNQGDRAERLYVVTSGRVAIRFKPDDGDVINVTEVEINGVFGWSAVLGRKSYTSSAICLEDCEAISVRGDVLRKLCESHPKTGVIILERMAEVIAERLRSTHDKVVELLHQSIHPSAEE